MADLFSIENELIKVYIFYTSILALKMLILSILTSIQRRKNKAFANPEDAARFNIKPKVSDNVERVRRAHRNDLENILVFAFISFGYVMTNPSVHFATMLFRVFTLARIVHTLVYAVYVIPQPARGLSFGIGYLITIYMAVKSVLYFI